MSTIITSGGRRCGKSHALAKMVAAHLKEGTAVFHASLAEGEARIERVVGVPGYDDGRQLEDKRDA